MKLLVVDDSDQDLVLVKRVLSQCKLLNSILLFSNGDACIEHIKTHAESGGGVPEPSILLLDLIMPGTSGLDVLRFLQNHEYAEHSIVIMLSGLKDIKAINEGYQLGAKTFLLKPVTPHDLVLLLNSLEDRVAIEEQENGYLLHWKERLADDSEILRTSSRAMTFSA